MKRYLPNICIYRYRYICTLEKVDHKDRFSNSRLCVFRTTASDTIIMLKEKKTRAGKSKARAAIARKNAEEKIREAAAELEKENEYWKEAEAEGTKSRGALKREEAANKRAEAVARKAETRRLEEEEKLELQKRLKKKTTGMNVGKVTESELRLRSEEEQDKITKKVEEAQRRRSRMVNEEEYDRMVAVRNTNADSWTVDARTIEEGISALVTDVTNPATTTTYKTFAGAKLVFLKETKPGLTASQRNAMLAKLWKRSHLNPANQREN